MPPEPRCLSPDPAPMALARSLHAPRRRIYTTASTVTSTGLRSPSRRDAARLHPTPPPAVPQCPFPRGVWRHISPFCALCGRVRSSRTPRSSAPTRPTSSCAPASSWRLSPRAPAAKSRHRRPRLDPSLAPGAWRLAVPPSPLAPTRRPHPPWHTPGRQARLLQLHGPARLWWRPVAPPRAARRHHVRRRPRWLHRRRQPRCSPPTRTLR